MRCSLRGVLKAVFFFHTIPPTTKMAALSGGKIQTGSQLSDVEPVKSSDSISE